MQIIQLTPSDLILAAHHTGVISGLKQIQNKGGLPNKRISDNTDYNIFYIGMLGEIAVSKYLGIPINNEVLVGGDGGIDMHYKNQSIQIKTRTHLKNPIYLMYKHKEEFVADWSILCTIETPTSVGIRGFISKAKFMQKSKPLDFGYGASYVVDIENLADMNKWEGVMNEICRKG